MSAREIWIQEYVDEAAYPKNRDSSTYKIFKEFKVEITEVVLRLVMEISVLQKEIATLREAERARKASYWASPFSQEQTKER